MKETSRARTYYFIMRVGYLFESLSLDSRKCSTDFYDFWLP